MKNLRTLLIALTLVFGFNLASQPPNILFILVDDLGYMDIGANNRV